MEAGKGGTGCAGRAVDRKGCDVNHLNSSHEISRFEPADVAPILRECAARRTLALVVDLETEWLFREEFAAFSDRSVRSCARASVNTASASGMSPALVPSMRRRICA